MAEARSVYLNIEMSYEQREAHRRRKFEMGARSWAEYLDQIGSAHDRLTRLAD